jgi:hypothetical protein
MAAQRAGRLFQRQGDVGAAAATGHERVERLCKTIGAGVDRGVVQRDAGLARERGMDARRQRMRNGMAEDGVVAHAGS